MPPRIPQIRYPDRTMKQAKISAMNTLLYFIRKGSDALPKKYEKSLVIWEETVRKRAELSRDRDPDRFVPVCDVEKYLRKEDRDFVKANRSEIKVDFLPYDWGLNIKKSGD